MGTGTPTPNTATASSSTSLISGKSQVDPTEILSRKFTPVRPSVSNQNGKSSRSRKS
ncbi:hypothetical protein H4Q26_009651, partial [Puccinia striiformis f. sp. tritici PST-130]